MKQIFTRLTKLENAVQVQVAVSTDEGPAAASTTTLRLPLKEVDELSNLNKSVSESDAQRTALVSLPWCCSSCIICLAMTSLHYA